MKKLLSGLLFFLFTNCEAVFSQCLPPPTDWSNRIECDTLNANGGICNGLPGVFCEGVTVGIVNTTVGNADTSYIDWDDGTFQKFVGNFSGCKFHVFHLPSNYCSNSAFTYNVKLGVFDTCASGCSFNRIIIPIDIKPLPRARFNLLPNDTVCASQIVTIDDLSCPNAPANSVTYFWNFGTAHTSLGQTSTNSVDQTIQFFEAGTYTVNLKVCNLCGCDSVSHTIYVKPPTTINPIISIPNNCAPVVLSTQVHSHYVDTSGINGFHWSSNNLLTFSPNANDSTPDISVVNGGTYYISVNADGCCADSQSICSWTDTVTLSSGPVISTTTPPGGCIDSFFIDPNNYFSFSNTTGGTTYQWKYTNASSTIYNGQNAPQVWFYQGTNKIVVTVTQSGCGPKKDSVTWIYYPTPVAYAGVDDTICEGQLITLTGSVISGTHATDTYLWAAVGCITTTCSVSPTNTTTYFFHVTNAGGCTDEDSVVITVLPSPTFTITPSSVDICSGDTSQQINLSPSNNIYTWSPTADLTYLNGAFHSQVKAHPSNSQTYTATTTASGCNYSQTLIVNVIPFPQLTVLPNTNVTVCQGSTLNLIASGAATYQWSPSTNISTTNSNAVIITGVSDITYTLIGSNGNGCNDTIQVLVHVDSSSINLTATPDTICIGQSTTLHVLGGTAPYTYNCTNAPCPSGGANPVVSPTITTTYTATANAGAGCSSSASVTVHVNPLPIISVNASNLTPCEGDIVSLNATGASTYSWSPSTNLSQTIGATVSVNPVPSNNISYTVIGIDGNNCSATGSVSLVVFPLPIVNAGGNGIFCDDIYSVNLLSLGATSSGHWSGPFTNDALATFYPDSAGYGIYNIVLTHTDLNGCTNTDSIVIEVDSSANSFAGNDLLLCLDAPFVNLIGTPFPGIFSGEGIDSTGGVYTFNPIIANVGTHIIHFNPSPTCYYNDDLIATVFSLPVPDITVANNDSLACSGQQIVLIASGGILYSWSPDTLLNNADTSVVIATPSATTTYTVIVTDINGCTASATQPVIVVPNPIADFHVLDNALCNGNEFQFFNQSLNSNFYLWDFHDSTTSSLENPVHVFPDSGNYDITLTAYTNDICYDIETQSGAITVFPVPSAQVYQVQDGNGYDTCSYNFHFQLLNLFATDSIIWNLGDGTISNDSVFDHEYSDDVSFDSISITLINQFGCITKMNVALMIEQCHYLFIPNTFSPNGNGTNDTFNVLGIGIDSIDLYVYDRWGSRLFHTTDLTNGWDGNMNDQPMGTGVYIYEVWVWFNDRSKRYLKGDVTLLR